jgi:hypothetical protein
MYLYGVLSILLMNVLPGHGPSIFLLNVELKTGSGMWLESYASI